MYRGIYCTEMYGGTFSNPDVTLFDAEAPFRPAVGDLGSRLIQAKPASQNLGGTPSRLG